MLQKKATGAVARELLTLCATADLLIKAKPSQALDLVLQRLKTAEATLGGSHWSVSQKLELLPPEQSSLTDAAENERGSEGGDGRVKDALDGLATGRQGAVVSEGRRKRKTRWQGRLSTWRKWSERRKAQGRWKEEGGDSGKRRLKGAGLRSEAKAGEDIPAECNETGTVSPGAAGRGGDRTEVPSYERGMEMASQAEKKLKPSCRSQTAEKVSYEAPSLSVHAAAPPFEDALELKDSSGGLVEPGDYSGSNRRGAGKKLEQRVFEGLPLGWCGIGLFSKLLEVLLLRSQDTGKGKKGELFPLPTFRGALLDFNPNLLEFEVFWCLLVCFSLNSLWGDPLYNESLANEIQQGCLHEILKDVKRFVAIRDVVPSVNWVDFFSVKSIDYKGDEVKIAQWFSWCNVEPALPTEVGNVPLHDVCTRGARDYVLNFDHYLKPSSEWKITRPLKVMVKDEDWPAVCHGLVTSGVCVYIPEEEVFHTDSGPLLNGMFGVRKDEVSDQGHQIFRLIMNLIPLNGLCKPLSGDVDTLPAWSSMNPFFLQPCEQLLITSEDVKCFFYTMSVPHCWTKFLAFNKEVPDVVLPAEWKGRRMYLASRVLPMGFLNSVSLAQHVHRNLVKWSGSLEANVEAGVNAPEAELRKDREFSSHAMNWRVYLDNYDLLEKVKCTEVDSLRGSGAPGVLALRNEYERWGVPRNLKKTVERSSHCELQGATVDGETWCSLSAGKQVGKVFFHGSGPLSTRIHYAKTVAGRLWGSGVCQHVPQAAPRLTETKSGSTSWSMTGGRRGI